jgi:hypothetical protein
MGHKRNQDGDGGAQMTRPIPHGNASIPAAGVLGGPAVHDFLLGLLLGLPSWQQAAELLDGGALLETLALVVGKRFMPSTEWIGIDFHWWECKLIDFDQFTLYYEES